MKLEVNSLYEDICKSLRILLFAEILMQKIIEIEPRLQHGFSECRTDALTTEPKWLLIQNALVAARSTLVLIMLQRDLAKESKCMCMSMDIYHPFIYSSISICKSPFSGVE